MHGQNHIKFAYLYVFCVVHVGRGSLPASCTASTRGLLRRGKAAVGWR